MEESDRLDMVQRRVRAEAKQDDRERRSRQIELFPAAQNVSEKEVDLDAVKDYWLRILSAEPQRFGIEKLADMLEDTGWFESDFQAAFGRLAKAGKARNLDGGGKRWKKFIHFDTARGAGERLIKVAT